MLSYVYRHRVRYRECDPMRVVYHAHYLDFFEAARTEALRSYGLAYRELEEAGITMPVIEVGVRFRRPAFYDDLLEITALFPEPPSTRVRVEYEVRRAGEEEILATGHVVLCFIDAARNRPVAAPPQVREVMERAMTDV